jgi:proteic killer suppression protein
MIKSYGDATTRRFAETGKSKFSGMDIDIADDRLLSLETLTDISDLRVSGKLRLHSLQGKNQGFWSIDINGPWRFWFRLEDGDCHDVTIIDPH